MKQIEIFHAIIDKLKEKYGDLVNLKTNNKKLNTKIFVNETYNYEVTELNIKLEREEMPILECILENGNYLLMTTKRMLSRYNGKFFTLNYLDYWWDDSIVRRKYRSIFEGETVVFKYYSLTNEPFWFEIDSFYPADAAHNKILTKMRAIYYAHELPPLELVKDTGFSDEPPKE
jgi:hypothetical protein